MIFMEKLSGRTVWFNVISSIFSPILQNRIILDKIEKEKWNDDMVERFLYKAEKERENQEIFNEGMLEIYPNITVGEILFEIADSSRDGFSSNIFQEIFPTEERGRLLSDTYSFFKEEF